MGRRADEPQARAHHQRLDRQGGRRPAFALHRAWHRAAASAGAGGRGAGALHGRTQAARCRHLLDRGRDGDRRSAARAVLGERGRTRCRGLYPSRRQPRRPLQALASVEQRRPGVRGGNGDLVADLRRRPGAPSAAENLHQSRRRLHAVLHGPHRPQLCREGQHPGQHEQAAGRVSAHALLRLRASTTGRCCSTWSTGWGRSVWCSARTTRSERRSRSSSCARPTRCRKRRRTRS